MQNSGLNRRKRLNSSSNSLGGGGQLVPRKTLGSRVGLKARSDKKKKWYKEERIPFVDDFLSRHSRCEFKLWIHGTTLDESPPWNWTGVIITSCGKSAHDVHEIFPQGRGGNAIPVDGDERNMIALCREHHIYVTQNPAWSRLKSYTR